MSLGFVMLVHEPLYRAAEVAHFWASAGCPIVIHVDARVPRDRYDGFRAELAEHPHIRFCRRRACEWGTWSLVAASQDASEVLLADFSEVRHIFLASGSCLPLRPVDELRAFLDEQPDTDFIESVTTLHVPWTKGGLDAERFTLRFPFPWKRRRRLFDAYVRLQRRLGVRRRLPEGIEPHLGSQWWCLTRQTLSAILEDPARKRLERYFRRVWIPDESYYQTLVRRYGRIVESRSLTLSKFDHRGKPHMFYDDQIQLLRRSDCFVARKAFPEADLLYTTFLGPAAGAGSAPPDPGVIDRVFSRAYDRRTLGRPGLYMQSRYPNWDWENGRTAAPYNVICGLGDVIRDFPGWLTAQADCLAHGHLFGPDRAEFAGGASVFVGGLPDNAALRNHNPIAFLANLLWNTRGERQAFLFGPRDHQHVAWFVSADPNARILIVSGAWAVPLMRANLNFGQIRDEAARLQRIEAAFIDRLRSPDTKARVRITSLAAFLANPMSRLSEIVEEIGPRETGPLVETPAIADVEAFPRFLRTLRNQGMDLHLAGEFAVDPGRFEPDVVRPRPYLVK